MRILLCEDDDQLARGLARALRHAGHTVVRAINLSDAMERLRVEELPDVALVDLSLPDGIGSTLVEKLKQSPGVGIIIVTAHGDEQSRVRGLRAGADDYVVKPFGVAELIARIEAVARRTFSQRVTQPEKPVQVGEYFYRADERILSAVSREADELGSVRLTRKESAVFVLLVQAEHAVVERKQLLTRIWPDAPEKASRSLDTHIGSLRSKLPTEFSIETVHGTGYRLRYEEEPRR